MTIPGNGNGNGRWTPKNVVMLALVVIPLLGSQFVIVIQTWRAASKVEEVVDKVTQTHVVATEARDLANHAFGVQLRTNANTAALLASAAPNDVNRENAKKAEEAYQSHEESQRKMDAAKK